MLAVAVQVAGRRDDLVVDDDLFEARGVARDRDGVAVVADAEENVFIVRVHAVIVAVDRASLWVSKLWFLRLDVGCPRLDLYGCPSLVCLGVHAVA